MLNRKEAIAPFPTSIHISGTEYPIKTSYRIVWQWMKLAEHPLLDDIYKFNGTLLLFLYTDPHDPMEATRKIQEFLLCGKAPHNETETQKSVDFEKDYLEIRAAFLNQWGIDLNADLTMHWWDFKSRFDELSDKSKIKQIMQIRTMPLPDPKNQEYYSQVVKAKEYYALE